MFWASQIRHITDSIPPKAHKGYICADPHRGLLGCAQAVGYRELESEASDLTDLSVQKKCQPIYTKGSCFDSMRHQKMISLCSETLKLAETKPNFSEWVRSQLLKQNETVKRNKYLNYKCSKCDYACTGNNKVLGALHYLVSAKTEYSTCDGVMEVLE